MHPRRASHYDLSPLRACGFVRFETIITKGEAYRQYYCGACDQSWQINASDPKPPPDAPDRSPNRRLKRSN